MEMTTVMSAFYDLNDWLRAVEIRGWSNEYIGVYILHTTSTIHIVHIVNTVHSVQSVYTLNRLFTVHTINNLHILHTEYTEHYVHTVIYTTDGMNQVYQYL